MFLLNHPFSVRVGLFCRAVPVCLGNLLGVALDDVVWKNWTNDCLMCPFFWDVFGTWSVWWVPLLVYHR